MLNDYVELEKENLTSLSEASESSTILKSSEKHKWTFRWRQFQTSHNIFFPTRLRFLLYFLLLNDAEVKISRID